MASYMLQIADKDTPDEMKVDRYLGIILFYKQLLGA